MTRADVGFALLMVLIALGLVNIAMLEAKPVNAGLPLVKADYQACITVRPGPIRRPNNFGKPYQRKPDVS